MTVPQCSASIEQAAQDLRHLYCSHQSLEPHDCQGQMLIDNKGICLACKLCGLDNRRQTPTEIDPTIKAQFILVTK
jgi:hypothetical protein